MPVDLSKIKNLVIVMMENRSFDHMLGYLSLPPFNRADVNGLSTDPAWLAQFTNQDQGQSYPPFLSLDPYDMPDDFDPPHERPNMALNLGPLQNGVYPMNGFVSGIPATASADPEARKLVMSYFGADQVPVSHFFAKNYTCCDHWFAALPAGTQPNRLMSMGGFSLIDINHDLLPQQDLVYDWLNRQGVSWRVYHQGIPFFTMMPGWVPEILLNDHFRSFTDLENDLMNTPPDQLPQVIFVEPTYQDAPHLGFATDEHAPSGVSNGQEFLMQVYNAVTKSRAFWQGAVMIVDYDENGAFFDHVSPPLIPTQKPPNAGWSNPADFVSLGLRTPAYVISPFVKPNTVSHDVLDHLSVLKFIGEKFGTNGSYSPVVDARPVASLSVVLNFDNPITDPPAAPALDAYLAGRPATPTTATVPAPDTSLKAGFQMAVTSLRGHGADRAHPKFGELLGKLEDQNTSAAGGTA
jgi:phospholipase C